MYMQKKPISSDFISLGVDAFASFWTKADFQNSKGCRTGVSTVIWQARISTSDSFLTTCTCTTELYFFAVSRA